MRMLRFKKNVDCLLFEPYLIFSRVNKQACQFSDVYGLAESSSNKYFHKMIKMLRLVVDQTLKDLHGV